VQAFAARIGALSLPTLGGLLGWLLIVAWPPRLASYGCLGSGPDPRLSGSSGYGRMLIAERMRRGRLARRRRGAIPAGQCRLPRQARMRFGDFART
jgi:hypothetical protein